MRTDQDALVAILCGVVILVGLLVYGNAPQVAMAYGAGALTVCGIWLVEERRP